MSILNSASSKSVYRGYDYYKEGRVISHMQLSDFEYEGTVQGTTKIPYNVTINTKHPKSSVCDCPFANGNTICKHMVALLFAISPEDLKDYEDWTENDYEDEYEYECEEEYYDDYYGYDRYGNYNKYKKNFVKPIFFDELLLNFVNNLSEEKLRKILIDELKKNEEYTFNNYLKKEFQKHISDKSNIHGVLDKINKLFYKLSHDYDYNCKDYTVSLLSKDEKELLQKAYTTDFKIKNNIDKLILNPELATYDKYKWIVTLYKDNNSKKYIEEYVKKLTSFLNTLKHYSIRNTIPKSNVLIAIHILNNYDLEESAKLIVKNCKYDEYIDFILDNYDCSKLYEKFDKTVEGEKYINEEYISNVYSKFYFKLRKDEIYYESLYYRFLNSKDIRCLLILKNSSKFDYYISKMIKNTKDIIALEKIYVFLGRKKELFELLCNRKNEYRLIANIEFLKDDYNNQLLKYLKERFYEVLVLEKSRENYKKAAFYVGAIYKLNDGEKIVNELIEELRKSEFSKRTSLFDEIKRVKPNK